MKREQVNVSIKSLYDGQHFGELSLMQPRRKGQATEVVDDKLGDLEQVYKWLIVG